MRRTFATLAIAAIAAALIGPNDAGAAATKAAPDACAAKASKFQRDQCEKFNASAPGDEYFGVMKLSYLGINNTFRDAAISAGAYTTDHNVINKVHWADDAMRAWMARYPNDPQLARTFYLGIGVFKKIYTTEYQDKAWDYMHLIVQKFPATFFGKQEKKDLALGFTQHVIADPLPCPTPLPIGYQPTNLPTEDPTPTPAPGRPNLAVINPPCIVATPTPSPTPLPEATPTLAPELPTVPLPIPSPSPSPTPTP